MLLQNPVKVEGTPATGHKSVYPSPIVLPNSLGLVTLGIAFHARPSQCTLRSRQTIFPYHDGTFPAIQPPLPAKELPAQLDGHRA
jgi:hypothetical protein